MLFSSLSRACVPLVLTLGLGAVSALTLGCSKKDADPGTTTTTTTTNGDSLSTAPSGAAPATPAPGDPGAPGAPGANGQPGGRGGRHAQAFVEACTGKNANDACTVALGARTLTGACTPLPGGPNQGQLNCRPTPGQFGPRHGEGPGAPGAPGAPGTPAAPGRPAVPQ